MPDAYPLCLYREGGEFQWDRRPTDMRIVADEAEHDEAEADGWATALNYWEVSEDDTELTDDEIRATLKDRGIIVHHKAGRPKLLEAFKGAA